MADLRYERRRKQPKKLNYEQYFEGYSEYRIPKKNGKGYRIERTYTAAWMVPAGMDKAAWKKRRLLFAGLAVLSIGLFAASAVAGIPANRANTVGLPMGFTAACMLFFLIYVGSYVMHKRQMTFYDCSSCHKNVIRWSALTMICAALACLMTLIYLFTNGLEEAGKTVLCAAGELGCAAAAFGVYLMERRTDYEEEKNDTVLPDNAESIRQI